MKRTPLKRGTSQLKRTPFKRSQKPLRRTKLRKRSKSPLAKAKERLWTLCRELTRSKYGNTCYSCGKEGLEGGNWQTGHFITKSTCSAELAYSLDNLRPQCYHCNINLSGNWVKYEEHLILDKGRDFPDILKKRNQETKGLQYDILWYEQKIKEYENL